MVLRWYRTKVYKKSSPPGNKAAGAPRHLRWVYSKPKLQYYEDPEWKDIPLITEEIKND